MFTKTSEYFFERTVTVPRPSPTEKDKIIRETFVGKFVALESEELEAFDEELGDAITVKDTVRVLTDMAVRIMVGWSEIQDKDKNLVPFSEATYREYLRSPRFRDAVISTYRAGMRGDEARLGN